MGHLLEDLPVRCKMFDILNFIENILLVGGVA